jgi:hypothetical protein
MCVLRGDAAALSVTAILHRDKLTLHALGGLPIRATITELMHAHLLEAVNDHDATRRRATIEHDYADGIRRIGDGATTGREALDAKAADLQAKLGDLQFIARRSHLSDIGFGPLSVSVGQTRKRGAGELGIRCCNHRRVVHRADRSKRREPAGVPRTGRA